MHNRPALELAKTMKMTSKIYAIPFIIFTLRLPSPKISLKQKTIPKAKYIEL